MNSDDFNRVAAAALQSIDALLAEWLPNGIVDGSEYCIGSRHGEAGKSMRICLSGARQGMWADFSGDAESGGSDCGGDLISLYAYLFNLSQGKSCAALAHRLGITLTPSEADLEWQRKHPGKGKVVAPAPKLAEAPVTEKKLPKPRTEWTPILPVPDDAEPSPLAHPVRGIPERSWTYRDQELRLLGMVHRFITSDGGKDILPCVYAEHPVTRKREWRWIHFRDPRPLYLPAPLRDGFPVLVIEGEKCADAAHDMLHATHDVVSWPGGGKAVHKVDWSPIAGREVVVWPDADAKTYKVGHPKAGELKPESEQPGIMCSNKIQDILSGQGCAVRQIDIPAPGVMPDGWDIYDLIDEGATLEQVLAWLDKLRPVAMVYPAIDDAALPPSPGDQSAQADDEDAVIPAWVTDGPGSESTYTPPQAIAGILPRKQLRSMLIMTSNGGIKGCRENVFMVLRHDPRLIGLVALDQFSHLQVKRRKTPWPSEPGEWTEGDDFHLGMYLAQEYYLVIASVSEIEKAVAQAAREHAFNPVVDYMNDCHAKWDGIERVACAFTNYWGAADSAYMQLIATMFFVGLVKRAFVPGVKHDCAPVFEGGQGEGKSTALAVLGGEWFADTPFRMGDKDGYLSIQGILIYEVAELEQFNRSETTAIKAFMSSLSDRYREPYGRRMKNMPRRTVFAATTNEGEYFKDTTGNRRFWPVEIGRMNIEALRQDRDQLFGEAVHMMQSKARWYPSREEQDTLITPEQERREISDPWLGRIYEYLHGIGADGNPSMAGVINKVTARELLTRALGIEIGKLGPAKLETMRISACMRKLGWTKDREKTGARERFYQRPVATASALAEAGEGDNDPIPF